PRTCQRTGRETRHRTDHSRARHRAAYAMGAREKKGRDEVCAMRSAEGRGRTLDEAVDSALIELGESRRNVDVKVMSEGSEETVVEVTVMDHAAAAGVGATPVDGKGEVARTLVEGLLKHMGIRAQVTT